MDEIGNQNGMLICKRRGDETQLTIVVKAMLTSKILNVNEK